MLLKAKWNKFKNKLDLHDKKLEVINFQKKHPHKKHSFGIFFLFSCTVAIMYSELIYKP